ncbi:mercuric transporter MerT family protein [Microvirga sp. VF16]|uniref:mercuric transporter MerT family protein n=1 Tax=Microvirga sp. VF16 TaxID=2807101 RepID=UPI00193CE09A|nr:mercuric transporter MerT family protein [Microvirga sp. VF16]QRM34714.1 mercury transporter MerT [Microvirga sp. VF16]
MHELTRVGPSDAASPSESESAPRDRQGLLAAGGLLAALGASSCCILPLTLFWFGVSGAWIGTLTALAPYQPVFVAMALAFLGFGFWRVYRQPKVACADGSFCAQPGSSRITKIGLWTAAVLVLAAVTFPYTAPLLISL